MAGRNSRIYLVRHGETEFNRLGVFRGRYEVELNEVGLKQAGETGAALAGEGIEFILTSPLKRAVVTAEIISRAIGIGYEVDDAFNNIDLGDWQGVPKSKVRETYPDEWRRWTTEPEGLVLPGGESVEDVRKRASARLLEVVGSGQRDLAIVTHRSVIKVLAAFMLGVPAPYFWKFYIDNAAYSVFEHSGADFTLINWNRSSHLSDKVEEEF
jgi:broad specificity phosphatase PhoE